MSIVEVRYGPLKRTKVEGHKTPVLSRQYFVVRGESYDANRLLRAAGLRVHPRVIHPNGSGGNEAYVIVDTEKQKLPTRFSTP